MLALKSNASFILPHVITFVTSQGRMKYVRPLYRALLESSIGSKQARETFEANKGMYHAIARKMITTDIENFDKKSASSSEEKAKEKAANRSNTLSFAGAALIATGVAIAVFVILRAAHAKK